MRTVGGSREEASAHLDAIDRRLIGELIADARASYVDLGERVGLSPAAVRVRVQRLLDDKLVTVSGRIDPRTAGTAVFELALISVDCAASVVAASLHHVREAVFVVCLPGRWGLAVEVRCRDRPHLVETLDLLRATPGVTDVESLSMVAYQKQDWSGLAEEFLHHRASGQRPVPVPSATELDIVDRSLISELIADGRATFAALAERVDLSAAAVRARVQRLLDDGIVVVQTNVNSEVLGSGSFAVVLVSARKDAQSAAERLREIPESTLVAVTTGSYEVLAEVWWRNHNHLLDIIDRARSLEEVAAVECYPYLAVTKEIYAVDGLTG